MGNVIAKIETGNWGEIDDFEDYWDNTIIEICEDGRVTKKEHYNLSGDTEKQCCFGETEMALIREFIDRIYKTKENTHLEANDGEYCEITLTVPGKKKYKTKTGYIYETKVLEPFVLTVEYIIEKLENDSEWKITDEIDI